MKFVNHTDIQRPVETVFEHVTRFDDLEKRARKAGAEVERIAGDGRAVAGSEWRVSGRIAGSERETQVRLVTVNAPSLLEFRNTATGFEVEFDVRVMPLAPNRARLRTMVDIRARTLAARITLQSARLIRPRISKRIDTALTAVAKRIEAAP